MSIKYIEVSGCHVIKCDQVQVCENFCKALMLSFSRFVPGGRQSGLFVLLSAVPEIFSHDSQLVPEHVCPHRQHPYHILLFLSIYWWVLLYVVPQSKLFCLGLALN